MKSNKTVMAYCDATARCPQGIITKDLADALSQVVGRAVRDLVAKVETSLVPGATRYTVAVRQDDDVEHCGPGKSTTAFDDQFVVHPDDVAPVTTENGRQAHRMTPAEHHEFQLLRMALVLDETNKAAAQVLRDAAEFIRDNNPTHQA